MGGLLGRIDDESIHVAIQDWMAFCANTRPRVRNRI